MSSMADRNRDQMIQRLQGNPLLDGAEVIAATPLMRVSILVTVFAGIVGGVSSQALFGQGGLQFVLGMFAGYAAYFSYVRWKMGEPRVIGVVAVLTRTKLILLGSRRAGIVAEYNVTDIAELELLRKGNFVMMGKLAITPAGEERITFMTTNRSLATGFVTEFEDLRNRGTG